MKTVDQRLYEAYRNNRGCSLTRREVAVLIGDDAVAARISNQAAVDVGATEPGCDAIDWSGLPTWKQFGESLKGNS